MDSVAIVINEIFPATIFSIHCNEQINLRYSHGNLVMFSVLFVFVVCLRITKKVMVKEWFCFSVNRPWPKDQVIQVWERSRSGCGYMNFN